jgi:hypothetical protein
MILPKFKQLALGEVLAMESKQKVMGDERRASQSGRSAEQTITTILQKSAQCTLVVMLLYRLL